MIEFKELLQGTVTGVTGALSLGLLLLCWRAFRNYLLKMRIRRTLRRLSAGSGIAGISTVIGNETQVAFRPLAVYLVIGDTRYRFKPTERVEPYWDSRTLWERLRLWVDVKLNKEKYSEPQLISTIVEIGSLFDGRLPDRGEAIQIAPFTSRNYLAPAELFCECKEVEFSGIETIVEYIDVSGKHRVLKVLSNEKEPSTSAKTVNQFLSEMKSGNLNKVRMRFRLPPIKVKRDKPDAGNRRGAVASDIEKRS